MEKNKMWVNILVRTLATVALFDFADFPLGEGALLFGRDIGHRQASVPYPCRRCEPP